MAAHQAPLSLGFSINALLKNLAWSGSSKNTILQDHLLTFCQTTLQLLSQFCRYLKYCRRRQWHPTPVFLPGESQEWGSLRAAVYGVAQSRTQLKWLSSWQYLLYVSRSVVSDSATPWIGARQAPLSLGFSRQEYWSGLPFPAPGDLPEPGIEPWSPTLQAASTVWATREATLTIRSALNS